MEGYLLLGSYNIKNIKGRKKVYLCIGSLKNNIENENNKLGLLFCYFVKDNSKYILYENILDVPEDINSIIVDIENNISTYNSELYKLIETETLLGACNLLLQLPANYKSECIHLENNKKDDENDKLSIMCKSMRIKEKEKLDAHIGVLNDSFLVEEINNWNTNFQKILESTHALYSHNKTQIDFLRKQISGLLTQLEIHVTGIDKKFCVGENVILNGQSYVIKSICKGQAQLEINSTIAYAHEKHKVAFLTELRKINKY